MRQLLYILAAIFSLVSCSTFDHSAIWDELREHEERIEALEAQCRQLNSNVEALQAVLTALQEHDYITDITKIMEDGVEVGYSITFAKGGTITIYHGTDGTEGSAPKIGIRKAADGEYYWTSDGEWLTDEDGEKIPAAVPDDPDGRYITPHFRVSDGRWYVSYDGGNTWMEFSVTANDEDDDIFQSITYDSNHLYITLSDGNVIALPREHEQSEVIYATAYGVVPGEVDASKMQELLDDASQMNKTIRFNDGEYIFGATVNVPSDVSLIGNTKTVFKPKDTATPSVLMQIHNADNVYLSHIILDGGLTSRPAGEGTQTGLSIVSSRSVNIENVEIIGWSRNGLYSKTMSSYGNESDGKFYKHLQMTNCRFYYNWCGNYFDYRCEYCQVLNCVWGENNIGTTNCGGNNAYTSCQWNANTTGFLMKNGGSNPAHGGCNACTFNHNYTDAIKIDDCVNGWTFEGCQIFYGKIVLNNSKGVIFDGNVWGSCKFFSTFPGNPNQNLITDTYFLTDSSVILAGNDGSTAVIDCLPDHLPETDILYGKILVTVGDSITYGADMQMEGDLGYIPDPGPDEGIYRSYGWQIADRNNMIFYQKGISGSTMQGETNPNGTDKGDISKKNGFSKELGRYTQLPDEIDFLTIMFGWNDAAYGTLGTIDDTTNDTYCGGFNVVMPYLIQKYPYTTIVLIVPFGTTAAHRQVVRDMAEKWGVGCFDMCANDLPFYYSEESDDIEVNDAIKKLKIELNQVNGAHPGYQGHYAISTRLEDYLRKCGCYDRENAVFYKVTYSTEYGTAPEDVQKVKVLYSTLFPTLTAEGHTFTGWYLDAEFTQKAIAGVVLYEDTTLYAKWD
ncbi:MAG: hypothetical protein E7112_03400 [Bacteroidales bacterium]|nr:hypothetical protein [Bacteroidales bacterium]